MAGGRRSCPSTPKSIQLAVFLSLRIKTHTYGRCRMVDAVSIVQLIISLAAAIQQTVATVKQNREDCEAIAVRVCTLDTDLLSLDGPAATTHPAVSSALEGLQQALHQALQVVMDCQDKSSVSRGISSKEMSKKLCQAKENISYQIWRVTLVASLQSNAVLNTQHPQHGVRPLPRQDGYSVNSREEEGAAPRSSCFKNFDLSELKAATQNFSDENVISESASCRVYKVKLPDGPEVAVKSYSKEQHSAFRKQCENEEHFAAKLLHTNIVKLLGHYSIGEQFCLVYEYMHNRSLSAYINGNRSDWKLSWPKRFNIIEGIARGAVYLHDRCGLRIIHLDLKPGNILLDHGFTPKIGDFGISEMLPESADEGVVASVMGTIGFQAPEYVHKGSFSVKSDVYSYGVLLIELITGMNCGQEDYVFNPVTSWVWEAKQQDMLKQCMDKRLFVYGVESHIEEIERCIHVALLCVEEDPALRPTMSDVLTMLSSKELKLPLPQKPAYAVNYTT